MQFLEFRAMNTSVLLVADGQQRAMTGMEATRAFIADTERRFSRFLADSELSQLNHSAGMWFPASQDLMSLLFHSLDFYRETDGLFDPSILPDLKRAGYDRSFDEVCARSAILSPASVRTRRPAFDEIELDLPGQCVRLPFGMEIDLGGIAKGWIVEKAAQLLGSYVSVCAVNAGGDIFFMGYLPDGSDWPVELEDPCDPNQTLAKLHVRSGAVVTSSIAKRTWKQGGQARHHLIDPRTGQPAKSNWLSVTVISPEIITGEVYAKALLIAGEPHATRFASQRSEIAYIAVDGQGGLIGSPNSKDFLYGHSYAS